jgi:hypothetical protein
VRAFGIRLVPAPEPHRDSLRMAGVVALRRSFLLGYVPSKTAAAGHPDYSWTDLYISLALVDKSTPRMPVWLVDILRDTSAAVTERICVGFQDLALGQLKSGVSTAAGTFEMHDFQLAYAKWRAESEELLNGQNVFGKDLIALPCKVNDSFEDAWSAMHEECGCETQCSKAADVALALDTTSRGTEYLCNSTALPRSGTTGHESKSAWASRGLIASRATVPTTWSEPSLLH